MKGTALFLSAMAVAATPIVVVLSQDSSFDQELRAPVSKVVPPRDQQHQPSEVVRSMRRTDSKAGCASSATTAPTAPAAPSACRGRR
jgi:hypothetical protein